MPGQDIIKFFLILAGGSILYIGMDLIVNQLTGQIACGSSVNCAQMLTYANQYKPLVPFVILLFAMFWLWVKGLNAQEEGY